MAPTTEEQPKTQNPPEEAAAQRPAASPKPRTRFIFKLLGLGIIAFTLWVAWLSYQRGALFDFTDTADQDALIGQTGEALEQLRDKTAEVTVDLVNWTGRSYDELREKIKGKPPETKEEISALVKESKRVVEQPRPALNRPEAARPKVNAALAEAQEMYRRALQGHRHTDPTVSNTETVQKHLRSAGALFGKCMTLLERARREGVKGSEIERLEHDVAERLYDCRKRTALEMK